MLPPKKATPAVVKLGQFRRQDTDSPGQDGGTTQGEEPSVGTDTARVLEAITSCQEDITACQTTLTARVEEVKVDISLVRQDFQKLKGRVTEAETRLSNMEDSLPLLQNSMGDLQFQVSQLLQKQDDIENRLRHCNLRFVGLPEGVEGKDPPRVSGKITLRHIWERIVLTYVRG